MQCRQAKQTPKQASECSILKAAATFRTEVKKKELLTTLWLLNIAIENHHFE